MSELKACPCCNGEAKLVRVNHNPPNTAPKEQRFIVQHSKVECQTCFTSSAEFSLDKQDKAVEYWNLRTRPAPERHNELREALELLAKIETDYRGLAKAATASNIKLPRTAADALETANRIKGFLARAALAEQAAPVATEKGNG